ncbi:MAG TPA: B12-binding domain-containing radical SAM protein [Candidatus Paceibacterota bacterium]|nr:B12-binding domain-containing radical SAM protein [Candidatus Paceibacterota bacterium]
MKVLLVYPSTPATFWSFQHVLPFISKRAAFPPLGLLTVAAMLPKDWDLKLVDTNVRALGDKDILWADYVMISAMIVHKESVNEIVERCGRLSKNVIAGGPLFTTGHAAFPKIKHFVMGEAEEIMSQLVGDMKAGTLKPQYRALRRPDITQVPVPRWDLINFRHYATLAVQFSRGCPFDCEFCDIIVMNGRVPRTKLPAQLVNELESLRVRGWKDTVFIVDDNFIGNKKQTKALLREMVTWRERVHPGMNFFTEASVNLADDAELCELMVKTGFKKVFLGIETPSVESLKECRKLQNSGRDLVETVKTLQGMGMEVLGGFIVGFDNDKHDIFERQFEFIQRSGVVAAMVGLLTALPETRLYRRLAQEGRIEAEPTGNNTDAVLNFKPMLNREFLVNGYRELMKRLYEPKTYYRRVRTFLDAHRPCGPKLRLSWSDFKAFLKSFWFLGVWHRGRTAYWWFFWATLLRRPSQFQNAISLAIIGHHFRRVADRL